MRILVESDSNRYSSINKVESAIAVWRCIRFNFGVSATRVFPNPIASTNYAPRRGKTRRFRRNSHVIEAIRNICSPKPLCPRVFPDLNEKFGAKNCSNLSLSKPIRLSVTIMNFHPSLDGYQAWVDTIILCPPLFRERYGPLLRPMHSGSTHKMGHTILHKNLIYSLFRASQHSKRRHLFWCF